MTLIKSLVFAGFVSNILAIIVCFLAKEFDPIASKTVNILMWAGVYYIHRLMGTW